MTDLEPRVRGSLSDRAGSAGEWRVPGEVLRGAAVDRASTRRRTAAAAAGALVVAGVVGVAVWSGDGPHGATPIDPTTSSATPSATGPGPQPEASWRSVELTDAMWSKVVEAAGGSPGWSPVVVTRAPGSDHVVVLLSRRPPGFSADPVLSVMTVTLDSDRPGARARSGTLGVYPSLSSIVSQPARVGDAALLVVLLPNELGDTVEVTTSRPGRPLQRTSGFVDNRLALVPVTRPEEVTHVRVLRAGRAVVDTAPPEALRSSSVPRTLDQVVASTDFGGQSQGVQVRTDGSVACRVTVGSWWGDGLPQIPWNPFDVACTTIDNEGLQLLIAEDRRYSSVAGLPPDGSATVRLTWQSGSDTDVTETPVRNRGEDVLAFIDESGHRPDQLTRAEALSADGAVLATARP